MVSSSLGEQEASGRWDQIYVEVGMSSKTLLLRPEQPRNVCNFQGTPKCRAALIDAPSPLNDRGVVERPLYPADIVLHQHPG